MKTLLPSFGALALVALAGTAQAAEIKVSNNIVTSQVWTADNTYNLQKQIYVQAGATLTIQKGTIVASDTNVGGSLAVARGAQIIVQGTAEEPVIMTSKADVATWTNNDPRTGSWREAANEWGNITIMGRGYISEDATQNNTQVPSASNVAAMEGLVASFPGDPKVLYGGGMDDDDSGSISYLSLRYGGKVIALQNELNGLSLGGIGRETDLHHIEIMNNVDDGIEIWGGTVNLKYVSIWNIGDDSFDIDQGWRGKAQFGFIVQGHSLDASQGSGVGDNMCETDGAENSDAQPVTRAAIYNFTLVGQPTDGDGAFAYRDGAGIQYRNCVVMDCGEKVVRFDNIDGDGAQGYAYNGTISWPATWTTSASVFSKVNAGTVDPKTLYTAQDPAGMINEIKDSVFYKNKDYAEADSRGVFAAANNNVKEASSMPIQGLTRGATVTKGGKFISPVATIDPRPAGDALASKGMAPSDGFFSPVMFRGAFRPGSNWMRKWTAADAFGFFGTNAADAPHTDLGLGLAGSMGEPILSATGTMQPNSKLSYQVTNTTSPVVVYVMSISRFDYPGAPLFGGTLVPNLFSVPFILTGGTQLDLTFPSFEPGFDWYVQGVCIDASGPEGFTFTNAIWSERP